MNILGPLGRMLVRIVAFNLATMVVGCTGKIRLTDARIQFLTITRLQQIFGGKQRTANASRQQATHSS